MLMALCPVLLIMVALRKESVDRNMSPIDVVAVSSGRSP